MPYLTPNIMPSGTICRTVLIPDDLDWLLIVNGALSELCSTDNFEQFGSVTPEEAADRFRQMFFEFRDSECAPVTPIGATMMWITDTPPDGWLILDGAALLADDYPELFALIGYTYGGGSGTFVLPDLGSLSPMGVGGFIGLMETKGNTQSVIAQDNLPNVSFPVNDPGHIHTITDPGHTHPPLSPSTVFRGALGGGSSGYATTNAGQQVTQFTTTGSATTGVSVNSHSTGISVESGGLDQGLDIVHPVVGVHYIIFAGH